MNICAEITRIVDVRKKEVKKGEKQRELDYIRPELFTSLWPPVKAIAENGSVTSTFRSVTSL